MRIFLSYRRGDAPGQAGRLHDALQARFGAGSVFQDVSTIRAGEDFVGAMTHAIESCDAMLVVVGPRWAAQFREQSDGEDSDDYVRLEIGIAISLGKRIVPVSVGGATLPEASALPDEVRPVLRRQAIELRDANWTTDIDALVRSLAGERRRMGRSLLGGGVIASVGALAALLAMIAWQPWSNDSSANTSDGSKPACAERLDQQTGWMALPGRPSVVDSHFRFEALGMGYQQVESGSWTVQVAVEMTNRQDFEDNHGHYRYNGIIVDGISYELDCFMTLAGGLVLPPGLAGQALLGIEIEEAPEGEIGIATEESRLILDSVE